MFIRVPNKANSRLSSAGGPLFSGWGEGFPSILLDGTAWYRSDRLITLNGSTVSAWGDLTGNGNTATQATEAGQLTYVENAINGKPALQTDGNDGLVVSALSYGDRDALTFIIDIDIDFSGSIQTILWQDGPSGGVWWLDLASSNNLILRIHDGTSTNTTTTPVLDGVKIIGVRYDGTADAASRIRFNINGSVSVGSNASATFRDPGSTPLDILRTDANEPASGAQIAEGVLFATTALSDDDMDAAVNYMMSRYGI